MTKNSFSARFSKVFLLLSTVVLLTECKKDELAQREPLQANNTLMATSEQSSSASYLYANDFGAVPGDGKSDNVAINRAIAAAAKRGIREVRFKSGGYKISGTIVLRSNVTLNGGVNQNTKLIADDNADGFTFMKFTGVTKAGVKNLYLDGRAQVRKTRRGNCAIYINAGSSYNTISNLTVTNFDSPHVGANYVTIVSGEGDNAGCHNNTISNSEFIDNNNYCHFAIRLYTDWTLKKASSNFQRKVSDNLIESCTFKNGFTWNVIECAGPGTVKNTINNCRAINNKGNSGFEADKGSSYNTFSNNIVQNLTNDAPEAAYGYRSQGLISKPYDRLAVGNKFINNESINIHNTRSKGRSGGIIIFHSNDTEVTGNTISNINNKKVTGPNDVAGIFVNSVRNLTMTKNTIKNSKNGIIIVGGTNNYNVNISANTFVSLKTAYKSFKAGVKSGFKFINNSLPSSISILASNEKSSSFQRK